MTNDPCLSVVVPTWNRSDETAALVDALATTQIDDRFTTIVVDDGSDDDTLERLASRAGPRLRVLPRPHLGVSDARNAGARIATSEWLAFLDSDDLPDPEWSARLIALLTAEVDLVSVAQRRQDREGVTTVRPQRLGPAFGRLHVLWQAGAFAIRRSLFEEVGGYRSGLHYSENTDLALRVGARHARRPVRATHDDRACHTVRVRAGRYDPAVRLASARRLLDENRTQLELQPRLLATYEAMAGVAAGRLGERRLARGHLVRAIRTDPRNPRHPLRLARSQVATRPVIDPRWAPDAGLGDGPQR